MGRAGEDGGVLHVAQIGLEAVAGFEDDLVFARLDGLHVDGDFARYCDAVGVGGAGLLRDVGAGDESLGGRAAGVDAGAAEELALDERDAAAGLREASGEGWAGLTGADDDGIEGRGHLILMARMRGMDGWTCSTKTFTPDA